MRVNKDVQRMIEEASREAVNYANNPDNQRRYLKRLLRFYDGLTEDERIYFLRSVLSNMVINAEINTDEFHKKVIRAQRFNVLTVVVGSVGVTLVALDVWTASGNVYRMLEWFKELLFIAL